MNSIIADFIQAIITDGLIIAVAAFVICQIIKTSLSFVDNRLIPLIGGLLGAVLGVCVPALFPADPIVVCAIKGLAIGWAATGAFETFKNLKS